ncbi:phosphomannomutase/phosphoglucomutase [Pseudomarimonas arenosa]|uniref:phosphomannomutase n=1 Tax=Pseudomarimonas arenosa TaxID=2774145 RepID=A0AAW3ZM34_9GAMM|nr:phosphomannomutase/phosphoglucomutase [Pseudomarimonas arenosa]MBD8527023.1 phosphomannomutase/phosphoglucomutase [Pseudomarimonas arenosa]
MAKLGLEGNPVRGAAYLLALLAVLAGLFFAWSGLDRMSRGPVSVDIIGERDRLAAALSTHLSHQREQFERAATDPYFRADVEAGALEDAAKRLQEAWPTVQSAAVYPGRLEVIMEQYPDLGFGRLAVLGAGLTESGVAIGPTGKSGALGLGLAWAIRDGNRALALVYAEVPFAGLADPIRAVEIGAGLIELRWDSEVVVSHGDSAIRNVAQATQVSNSNFKLASAMPTSLIGATPMVAVGLGGVAFIAAVLLWGAGRRYGSRAVERAPQEPTFDETLRAESAVAAPEAQRAAAASKNGAGAKAKDSAKPKSAPVAVDRSIFRAYDIRGVLGKTLDTSVARLIGQSIGSAMQDQGLREIVVGRDGRLSGPDLSAALIEGLRAAGCDVIDIGQAATPVVYFASYHLQTGSCVAVTGSHNPPDYNGFKIVIGGETLSGAAITDLYDRIADDRLRGDGKGGLQSMDVSRDYIDRISSDVQLERRMRVVIDCGNGVPGAIAPEVLESIGCEVECLYCDVDGEFPNHHPDPSDPNNLRDLITAVQRTGAELGMAFDGDGDRLGVVTSSGKIIFPDRLLMLFAQDVLSRNPGAAVIYDVKCSGHLSGQILRHGGSPVMWKTGHSLIKAKMRETGAELAGEMSGHFFFRERWFGFDDGIYSAARLLEILAADDREPQEIFEELPDSVATPEIKVDMEEGEHYAFMDQFRERAQFDGAKIFTIDGVRADWPDGWGLVRCSNTTPCLVLRFEADNEQALARIQAAFRAEIEATRPGIDLPF